MRTEITKYLEQILVSLTNYDFRFIPIHKNNYEIKIISNKGQIPLTEDDITISFQKQQGSCTIIHIIDCDLEVKNDIVEILTKTFGTKPLAYYKFTDFPYHSIIHFCYYSKYINKNIALLKQLEKENKIFNLQIKK